MALCGQPVQPEFRDQLYHAATTHEVNPALLLSVVATESRCSPDAVSSLGAKGYAQIYPRVWQKTADKLGYDLDNPQENLLMGAWILKQLRSKYSRREALRRYFGYQNTPESHRRADAYADSVLMRFDQVPPETI